MRPRTDFLIGGGLLVGGVGIRVLNTYQALDAALATLREHGASFVADALMSDVLILTCVLVGLAFIWDGWRQTKRKKGGGGGRRGGGGPQTQDGAGNVQVGGNVHGDVNINSHHAVESQRPKIIVSSIRAAQLHETVPVFWLDRPIPPPIPLYFVCQIWFRNEPPRGYPVAKSLTAFMSFSLAEQQIFNNVRGEWAMTNAPENIAFKGTCSTWAELPPNGEEIKLVVAQKKPEEPTAYVWLDGAKEYADRKHPSFQLPPGKYRLGVRVRGIDVDNSFVFDFTNPGIGGNPEVTGPV